MHNKNISSLYQNNLVSHKIDINRLDMAEREIKTLTILMNLIQAPFPESGVFLDLGCGDRYLEAPVSKRGIDYIGLDIDTVNFENSSIPVETGSVDFAVSLAVLEHLRDPSIFLSEIYRCLKPGGVVYLSTPNFQYDMRNFYNDPTHVRPYTPTSLQATLRLYGFVNVNTFPGIRCKSKWWYQGTYRFWKAFYFLPFRGDFSWAPSFLKGHARSIFALAVKPIA